MKRWVTLFCAIVIAVAVVGFFVGIGDGVPHPDGVNDAESTVSAIVEQTGNHSNRRAVSHGADVNAKLVPALSYAEIPNQSMGPTKAWQATPQRLPQPKYDLYARIDPSPAAKAASSKLRASRRAFNGAPPIIPHPTENTNDAACYACHSSGVNLAGVKASVMSHPFLGNCVQCHAPMAPGPFLSLDASVESSFVGLPAPQQGTRAYPGAPPTIPHSRWMRENCLACHGGPYGWAGMESTHPWRTNCTQCHAPSAVLDQMPDADAVPMLPPLDVVSK